jgi:hypothetical protein
MGHPGSTLRPGSKGAVTSLTPPGKPGRVDGKEGPSLAAG